MYFNTNTLKEAAMAPINNNPLIPGDVFAVYGTLKKGRGNHERLNLSSRAESLGTDTVQGVLYHLGGFPGFQEFSEQTETIPVVVELYRIVDETLGYSLDSLEGFRPGSSTNNFYTRNTVTTDNGVECDIYVYVNEPETLNVIEDGNY